jgi:hypothetical protein
MTTEVVDGDNCLDALRRLGGEASTAEVASEAGLGHIRALVTLGNLGRRKEVVHLPTKRKNANPNWRLLQSGEEGFVE